MGVDVVHLHPMSAAERGRRACQQAQEPAISGWVRQARHRLQGESKQGTGTIRSQALQVRSNRHTDLVPFYPGVFQRQVDAG